MIEELIKTLRNFKIPMPEEVIGEWRNFIIENSILIESSPKIEAIKDFTEE